MQQKLQALKSEAIEALNNATAVDMLNDLRVKYLGKKGEITTILRGLGALSPEERPLVGQLVNEVRAEIEEVLTVKIDVLKKQELAIAYYTINHLAYSGLMRYNKKGEYNVPFGKYQSFPNRLTIAHTKLLMSSTIVNCDYKKIFHETNQ